MATKPTPEGQAISEVARAEGGTTKGSMSAQMQSEVAKQRNAEQGVGQTSSGTQVNPNKSPEGQAISEVAQQDGNTKGSTSAQMQSEITKQKNAEQGMYSAGGSGQASAGGTQVNPNKSPEGQAISEVAQQEGGTTKGSKSAQMQSELTKQKNAEQGMYSVGGAGGSAQPTNPNKSPEGQAISDVAQQEGGTTKGSMSAQMQSELTKQKNAEQGMYSAGGQSAGGQNAPPSGTRSAQSAADKQANFEEAAEVIGSKMQQHPEAVTKEDANTLESREHKAMGVRPPKDTIAAEAKRMATANEQGRTIGTGSVTNENLNQADQSQLDREANFREAVDQVAPKMANAPEQVTKEEGDMLHSREQRAHGRTEKGGIASQAQQQAARNEQ